MTLTYSGHALTQQISIQSLSCFQETEQVLQIGSACYEKFHVVTKVLEDTARTRKKRILGKFKIQSLGFYNNFISYNVS